MTDSMSLRVCWGALVDLVKAASPATEVDVDDMTTLEELRAERATNQRALAIIVAGGYGVGLYKTVFFWLEDQFKAGADVPDIARDMIATFGTNPPCRITAADVSA